MKIPVVADGEVGVEAPVSTEQLPLVAIVGRPNVGKSTLFNRLVGAARAVVDAQAGVTRDRNVALARWQGRRFMLVDTGGFDDAEDSSLAAAVRAQSAVAAEEADAVIAVFDGRAGVNPLDRDFMWRLRRLRKPVLCAVNKLDTPAWDDASAEFFTLGLPQVFAVSAAHGRGVGDLIEALFAQLPAGTPDGASASDAPAAMRLAIVGRPNVGKSSLVNRIVGYDRAVVDASPGTTRDATDTVFCHDDHRYVLVDTAGIRRRPRVHAALERASVVRALRALERAELALLVLDATVGVTDQDMRILAYAWDRGRASLLVVNKWDAVQGEARNRKRFATQFHDSYPVLAHVPAVFLSARTGYGVQHLFPALRLLVDAHRRQIRTVELNDALEQATAAQAPPTVGGKRPRFYYATQTATAPPTFTIFSNAPEAVASAYVRYLQNFLRAAFGLQGTPVRLCFRARPKRRRDAWRGGTM